MTFKKNHLHQITSISYPNHVKWIFWQILFIHGWQKKRRKEHQTKLYSTSNYNFKVKTEKIKKTKIKLQLWNVYVYTTQILKWITHALNLFLILIMFHMSICWKHRYTTNQTFAYLSGHRTYIYRCIDEDTYSTLIAVVFSL